MSVNQWEAGKAGQWREYPTEWAMYPPDEEPIIESGELHEQDDERERRNGSSDHQFMYATKPPWK
jgi:hypothetical protein